MSANYLGVCGSAEFSVLQERLYMSKQVNTWACSFYKLYLFRDRTNISIWESENSITFLYTTICTRYTFPSEMYIPISHRYVYYSDLLRYLLSFHRYPDLYPVLSWRNSPQDDWHVVTTVLFFAAGWTCTLKFRLRLKRRFSDVACLRGVNRDSKCHA